MFGATVCVMFLKILHCDIWLENKYQALLHPKADHTPLTDKAAKVP